MENLNGNDGEWFADKFDECVDFSQHLKDPYDFDKYKSDMRFQAYATAKKMFDFERVFAFCQDHRVEVLVQDDTMYHCYIDWHKEKGAWAVEMDGFTSLIMGIHEYTKRNG
jgi:hypothetical protein